LLSTAELAARCSNPSTRQAAAATTKQENSWIWSEKATFLKLTITISTVALLVHRPEHGPVLRVIRLVALSRNVSLCNAAFL
jgi:hypothetical protein